MVISRRSPVTTVSGPAASRRGALDPRIRVREHDIAYSAALVEGTVVCHGREREPRGGHVRSQKGRRALVRVPFLDRGAVLGERTYFVYIMASRRNGTLYIGVTSNLALRAHQHRTGVGSTFTTKYGVKMLVWYEQYGDVNQAIAHSAREAVEDLGAQMETRADRAF